MYRTMEHVAVVISFIAAFVTAIWYSAPVWVAAQAPAQDPRSSCRLRLAGALEGGYPCTVEEQARPGRLTLVVATEPGAVVKVRFQAELEPAGAGGAMTQAPGTTLRALVQERRRTDVGAAWLGPEGLEVQAAPGGGPVRLRMVVPPAPENPERRAVEVEVDVALSRLATEPPRS